MMLFLKVAYRNLRRHSRQSLAAILSVTAGFISLVMFEGYLEQTRRMILSESRERMMAGDVIIEHEGTWSVDGRAEPWKHRLGPAEQKAVEEYLAKSGDVAAWMTTLRLTGVVSNGRVQTTFFAMGFDTERAPRIRGKDWYWHTPYGVPLEESGENGVLLGFSLARRLGCLPSPKVDVRRTLEGYPAGKRPIACESSSIQFASATPTGQVSAVDLEVAGLIDGGFKDLDSRLAMMPLPQAQSLAHTRDVSYYSVALKDRSKSKEFAAAMQSELAARGHLVSIMDWRDHKTMGELYRKVVSLLNVFRDFIVLIVLCIATLSVLNTMIKIIKERTREIGAWRSLGYTRRDLIAIFALEAVLLGGFGCLVGAVATFAASVGINAAGVFYSGGLFMEPVHFSIALVPGDYLTSFAILIGVSVAASLWATRGVLGKKVSENLIHT